MRSYIKFLTLNVLLVLSYSIAFANPGGNKSAEESSNPLDYKFNQVINFDQLKAEHIKIGAEKAIADSENGLKAIYSIPKEKRTFDNTLLAIDNLDNEMNNISYPIYLMMNASPLKEIRDQAAESSEALDKYSNEVALDENLYRSVKEYSETAEAKKLSGYKKKYLDETLRDFLRNGFALTKEKRDELKVINDRLAELSIEFNQNIATYRDSLMVSEKDMEGLPEDYKQKRKQADGSYKIDLAYPSYTPFMKYSTSDKARKELYMKFNNRASEKNLPVLKEVLVLRKKKAALLGYKSFAAYQVEERMVKKPEVVWKFENELLDKVKLKAKMDYDELLSAKKKFLNDPSVSVINNWESGFYSNLLLKEKYEVNAELVKEYFELNNVLDGLFQVSQTLYGVTFEEVKNPSVWHKEARLFDVKDDGKLIGRFYLDLFPRDNKFTHAACFPMFKGKATSQGYQIPTATLLCNFTPPSPDKPALMLHTEVETFFHEFGHVLHNILTKAELTSFSGTSVARDFVEAPSQIFENWTWNYESLKLFAKHYKTGEVIPTSLFEKMLAAKNVGSGIHANQQIFYGLIDMTLHDAYDPEGPMSTTDVIKELQNKTILFPYVEGTTMQTAFGHLMGYDAGYYGYLWSEVYAQDMFSVFEKNGIMDKKTGKRYRDIILAKGGNEEPLELVKQFLGREPKPDAFLKSLGLN